MLEIVKSLTSDEIWPKHMFISRSNFRLTRRFVLGSTTLLRWYQSLLKICWTTCYQIFAIEPSTINTHIPSSKAWGARECVKSPTSNEIWSEHMFISRDNTQLTNWFCKIVRSNHNSKKNILRSFYLLYRQNISCK